MYICAIVSTAAIVLITLNIFGVFTSPHSEGNNLPLDSTAKFDWKYFLSFTVFPVLILFNLVFWVFTAVSGRMLSNRPGVRQAMQFFYSLVTVALLGILMARIM